MMITANANGFGASSIPNVLPPEIAEVREVLPAENKKTAINRNITVEEYVKTYFSDVPVMIEVARCESRFRQHDKNGEVLRGEENSLDRGVMQINEYYHEEDSLRLGYDILTLEGNTAYARYLLERYGLKPWKSSARCWGRTVAYSDYIELAMNRE